MHVEGSAQPRNRPRIHRRPRTKRTALKMHRSKASRGGKRRTLRKAKFALIVPCPQRSQKGWIRAITFEASSGAAISASHNRRCTRPRRPRTSWGLVVNAHILKPYTARSELVPTDNATPITFDEVGDLVRVFGCASCGESSKPFRFIFPLCNCDHLGHNFSHSGCERLEAIVDLFEYVEVFYNRSLRYSTLGYVAPPSANARLVTAKTLNNLRHHRRALEPKFWEELAHSTHSFRLKTKSIPNKGYKSNG